VPTLHFGPGRSAPLDFFAAQGFPYQQGYNAAEYLIDTLNQHDKVGLYSC
jgi:hypothetical protein